MKYTKTIGFFLLGLVIGYVVSAIGVDRINEDIYWGQYKHGIVDGWNNGFESGNQFGQGKVIHYYQQRGFDLPDGIIDITGNFSDKTTWYYRKGYDSIAVDVNSINPYNFIEVNRHEPR